VAGLLCCWALLGPGTAGAVAEPPEPTEPPATTATEEPPDEPPDDPAEIPPEVPPDGSRAVDPLDWIDDQRLVMERGLGDLSDYFDHFFGDDPHPDQVPPSSRLRFRSFVRTTPNRLFAAGGTVAASTHLPRLERWLDNARLVLVGDTDQPGLPTASSSAQSGVDAAPVPPTMTDASASYLWRGRGHVEVRFDLLRGRRLIIDTGVGTTLAWPPVPFTRLRAHLRLGLGAGFLFRATGMIFAEAWGRGPGTSNGVEVGRFLTPSLWLRWAGQGLFARSTRGIEWSSLVGAEWKVHPRTGLFSGVGASGFGTPHPGLDVWHTWVGARQDIWRGWVFAGLQPELIWPRPAGFARRQEWAVTARLELVFESRRREFGAPP
jgi:hypothetical protein